MLMLAGVGRLGFVLLLPLLLPTATAEQAGARSVGVCWKPFSRATLAGEVRNMSAQLSATELIVYCGLGALTNGSFGIVTAAHPNRWGQTDLCLPAIATARQGGIASIQVMVESRTDMPAFAAALGRGGQAFGREMFALLGSRYPGVSGVTFDFERGEDKSAPFPTPQQFATFLGGVVGASPRLSDGSARYAVDVSMDSKGCAYLSDFPPLLRVGVRRVRDMGECNDNRVTVPQSLNVSLANPPMVTAGLYHAPNGSFWQSTLAAAVTNAAQGANGSVPAALERLDVGLSLPPKFPWEHTPASVTQRFAAARGAGVRHVHVFDYQFGQLPGVTAEMQPAWTQQLRDFIDGGGEESQTLAALKKAGQSEVTQEADNTPASDVRLKSEDEERPTPDRGESPELDITV
jgi:hypothetical protein